MLNLIKLVRDARRPGFLPSMKSCFRLFAASNLKQKLNQSLVLAIIHEMRIVFLNVLTAVFQVKAEKPHLRVLQFKSTLHVQIGEASMEHIKDAKLISFDWKLELSAT